MMDEAASTPACIATIAAARLVAYSAALSFSLV